MKLSLRKLFNNLNQKVIRYFQVNLSRQIKSMNLQVMYKVLNDMKKSHRRQTRNIKAQLRKIHKSHHENQNLQRNLNPQRNPSLQNHQNPQENNLKKKNTKRNLKRNENQINFKAQVSIDKVLKRILNHRLIKTIRYQVVVQNHQIEMKEKIMNQKQLSTFQKSTLMMN